VGARRFTQHKKDSNKEVNRIKEEIIAQTLNSRSKYIMTREKDQNGVV